MMRSRRGSFSDGLLPDQDVISDDALTDPTTATALGVAHGDRFRVGDQVRPEGSPEILFVTAVEGDRLTVIRAYGGTTAADLEDGMSLRILGNAALEGDDRPAPRFTARARRQNYTQIFTAAVEVSGTQQAVHSSGVADELDYQKQERLRELLRDLEKCVIGGTAPAATPQGSATVRRTMKGIIPFLTSNVFLPGQDDFPSADSGGALTEAQISAALKRIWEQSAGRVDTILVNGTQKRRINSFIATNRRFTAQSERYRDLLSVYESDFGVCRVVLARAVPADMVLLLDSSRIQVLPLAGRSFQFQRHAATGDREAGQIVGEYTLELRHELAHGLIRGLATT